MKKPCNKHLSESEEANVIVVSSVEWANGESSKFFLDNFSCSWRNSRKFTYFDCYSSAQLNSFNTSDNSLPIVSGGS